ncbi:hypothetical protein M595_3947 [Lyngbya aestuarii BL J]|uniref:Uncharacterized protein n=1 Tax=Lyngbya aestuarii BL J TaxID=1348334 RepID=U7QE12_9CYAN|nr:hypothetical protein M595_3947 [Lyngbya aestuarii BL J]
MGFPRSLYAPSQRQIKNYGVGLMVPPPNPHHQLKLENVTH